MLNKSIIVGITGQTGAGKSTVADIMSKQGCIIMDADKLAKRVINQSIDCKNKLTREFGYDILMHNGEINRKLLAQRAFETKEKAKRLNEITHPYIVNTIEKNINELKYLGNNIIAIDAALLYESGANLLCDKVVCVIADYDIRVRRIIERDGISFEDANLRISAQNEEEFYVGRADYVINGAEDIEVLSQSVKNLVYKLREARNV